MFFVCYYIPDQRKIKCVMKLLMILKILNAALCSDENILYFNEDSGNGFCSSNETDIPNTDLNNINLDNNLDEDDPNTIILIRISA